MASVYIPTPYRKRTGNQSRVEVPGATVGEVLHNLAARFPALREDLFDPSGALPHHLNVYVDEQEVRSLQGLETPVTPGATVAIIPAMAGGSGPLFSEEELERYSRNILLKEVGIAGQKKLKDARVLLVGAGGLGSPAALYLAAAGVGTLGIVDGDRVDRSNLQRQVLHNTHDLGVPKAESARRHLADLNPHIRIVAHQTTLTSANAMAILPDYDVVVNGCDNFPTRYLVNDACVLLKKPLVDASILMWEAQAAVFVPGKGCYRCLYPSPPPPGSVPSCGDAGVIGAMAGHLGTWQALETVKIILGAGEVADDRLLLFDALAGEWRSLKRRRNPRCPVCGDNPTVTELIDYEQFCGVPGRQHPGPVVELEAEAAAPARPAWQDFDRVDVLPAEVAAFLEDPQVQWIDVREPQEYAAYHIPGATLIPMGQINRRWREIDPQRPAIIICEVGQRSAAVTQALRRAGYTRAYNLRGGMLHWFNQQLPVARG